MAENTNNFCLHERQLRFLHPEEVIYTYFFYNINVFHFLTPKPVFRIRDIFLRIRMRIRILGSVSLINGSGWDPDTDPAPDPALFDGDLKDAKKKFFSKFFCLFLFEGTFTSFFKDPKRYHKTVENKVFFSFFACWWKDPDPEPDP